MVACNSRGSKNRTGSILIRGRRIFDLQYADHTALIALDEEEIPELINLVKITSEKLGLRINASKMKVMVIGWAKFLLVPTALSKYKKINVFIQAHSSNQIRWRLFSKNTVSNCPKQIIYNKISRKIRKRLIQSLVFCFPIRCGDMDIKGGW